MKIISIKITGVELTEPLKIFEDNSIEYGQWNVEPVFTIGFNEQKQCVQNIDVLVVRTIGKQHASIKTQTSFHLELATKEYRPTTEEDFKAYAMFQQLAIAHARAFFIIETKGTIFQGGLIPVDSDAHALQKIKLGIFNINQQN